MPSAASRCERLGERVGAHPVALVGRDQPARRPRPTGDAQRLVDAMMGEAGQIDGAAAFRDRAPRGR